MLVLSRQKNQRLVIADGLIQVVVVEIRGDKVRLGIEAPDDVSVDRLEVFLAKQRNSQRGAGE